tara:strand:- start:1194 stop:1688 length:495 start_codon:yes stop_codon:yes gene_type:complete
MTLPVPIRVADAVVTEINGQSFEIGAFTSTREYPVWDQDFKDLDTMVVNVVFVVHQTEIELATRGGSLKYEPFIDICVRKRFTPDDDRDPDTGKLLNTSVDPLCFLLEEMHEYFISERKTIALEDETTAKWEDSDVKSWVNLKLLRKGLFEGVVRIKFRYGKTV